MRIEASYRRVPPDKFKHLMEHAEFPDSTLEERNGTQSLSSQRHHPVDLRLPSGWDVTSQQSHAGQ